MQRKLPNRIRELREEQGLSQDDLAEEIGVKQPTIARHESGNRGLDGFQIERYAKFFQISPYEIFVKPTDEVESDTEPALTTR